jgi:hypothetical protein
MIDNKKIPTWLGTAIIIIFAITAGMFVRQVVKNQDAVWQSKNIATQSITTEKKQATQNQNKLSEKKDGNGCLISSGYFWCDKTQSCVQNWDDSCGKMDILDMTKWETLDSKNLGLTFNFSFKYPSSWFNEGSSDGGAGSGIPLYSKKDYSSECNPSNGNLISCSQAGFVALVNILTSNATPKVVHYDNEQKKSITIGNYKGTIISGTVNDVNNGYVANNGQKESVIFFDVQKGMLFRIAMKIVNDSDENIFNQIISTLKF